MHGLFFLTSSTSSARFSGFCPDGLFGAFEAFESLIGDSVVLAVPLEDILKNELFVYLIMERRETG